MQDKDFNIDEKLAAKGWQKMSILLDQELPLAQHDRKRFGFWIWLMGLAVVTCSLVLALCLREHNAEDASPAIEMADPAAAVAGHPVLPSASPQNKKTGGEPSQEAPAGEAHNSAILPPSGATLEKHGRPATPFREAKTAGDDLALAEVNEGQYPPSAKGLAKGTRQHLAARSSEILPPAVAPAGEASLPARPEEQPTTRAPEAMAVPVIPLTLFEAVAAGTPKSASSATNWNRINWAGYTTGLVSPEGGGRGFATGALASYRLNGSRFSVECGAGYSFIQKPVTLTFWGGATLNSQEFKEYTVELGNQYLEDNFSAVQSTARAWLVKPLSLHYLNIPLRVRYRIGTHLSILAGVSNNLLIFTSTDYAAGGLVGTDLKKLEFTAKESQAVGQVSRVVTVRLSDYELAGVAGLGFDINRRLSTEIKYEVGATDFIQNNTKKDLNRHIGLSLLYHW